MATAASQGMVAVTTLLAARACDPALFGLLGVFTTLVVIGGAIASLRLEAAVVLPARDADARRLAVVGLLAAPIVAAVAAVAMVILGPVILPHFDAADLLAHP
jgi:O-antigen/teichoic acid export membrane protein